MDMQALRKNLQPLLAWHNLPTCMFEPSKSHQAIHAVGWLHWQVQCVQCQIAGQTAPRDANAHGEKWLTNTPQAREFTQDPRVGEIITQVLQGHTQSPAAQEIAQQLGQEPYLTLRRLQQQAPFRICTLPQLRTYLAWQDELQSGKVCRVPFELALLHITYLHAQHDINGLRDFLQFYGPHDRSIARRLVNLLRARGVTAQLPERAKPQPKLSPAPPPEPTPEPRKPVAIDFAQLDDIRTQAAEMTELLVVEDESVGVAASPLEPIDAETLIQALSPEQTALVNNLLQGGTANELDIDAINEIAWEILGDNLIEHGQMIEEYMQAWKEGKL